MERFYESILSSHLGVVYLYFVYLNNVPCVSLSTARCFITQQNTFLQFPFCNLPSRYVLEKLWKIKVRKRKMLSWQRDATSFQFSDADSDVFEEAIERRRETVKSVKRVRDRLRSLRKNPLLGMAGYFCLFVARGFIRNLFVIIMIIYVLVYATNDESFLKLSDFFMNK